jgi:hypothetical protein
MCKRNNIQERDIALTSFDSAHVIAMESCQFRKLLLREALLEPQSDAQVFKKYSQMKLQMKREALEKINRRANEVAPKVADALMAAPMCTVTVQ